MIKLTSAPGAIYAFRQGEKWIFVVTGCTCGKEHKDRLVEAEQCALTILKKPASLEGPRPN